ncbi:MucR family transcriptional regulator [Pleomorphomonas oryzae]|uniref:MucR family transcriptional regulator n=1 Tax=Pleomorphomonas oryzae TaxID=261934 RepID=UPI0003F9DBEE|nr:MucR family transcriptional regulator [Pleomorphomonas oryzae]
MDDYDKLTTLDLTASIVAAYVGNNSVPVPEMPALIASVHSTLARVRAGNGESQSQEVAAEPAKPAVSIKKSITPDYLICLEDGKKFKSLKRHLRTHYDMSPDEYRAKWNLPSDYPMVAPNYAEARSNLAKQMGLGQQRKRSA